MLSLLRSGMALTRFMAVKSPKFKLPIKLRFVQIRHSSTQPNNNPPKSFYRRAFAYRKPLLLVSLNIIFAYGMLLLYVSGPNNETTTFTVQKYLLPYIHRSRSVFRDKESRRAFKIATNRYSSINAEVKREGALFSSPIEKLSDFQILELSQPENALLDSENAKKIDRFFNAKNSNPPLLTVGVFDKDDELVVSTRVKGLKANCQWNDFDFSKKEVNKNSYLYKLNLPKEFNGAFKIRVFFDGCEIFETSNFKFIKEKHRFITDFCYAKGFLSSKPHIEKLIETGQEEKAYRMIRIVRKYIENPLNQTKKDLVFYNNALVIWCSAKGTFQCLSKSGLKDILYKMNESNNPIVQNSSIIAICALAKNLISETNGKVEKREKKYFVNCLSSMASQQLGTDHPAAAISCLDDILKIDPENDNAISMKIAALHMLKRYKESTKYLRKLVNKYPHVPDLYLNLARTLSPDVEKEKKEAIYLLKRAVDLDDSRNSKTSFFLLNKILMRDKQYDEAIFYLKKFCRTENGHKNADAYRFQAECMVRKGNSQNNLNEALKLYKISQKYNEYEKETLLGMSNCLLKLNKLEEAETLVKNCLEEDEEDTDFMSLMANVKGRQKKFAVAEEIMEKVIEAKKSYIFKELYLLAIYQMKQGKVEKADENFERSAKLLSNLKKRKVKEELLYKKLLEISADGEKFKTLNAFYSSLPKNNTD